MTRRPAAWPTRLREERGPLLALVAVAALLFGDVLFRGRVLFERDIHLMWLGQVETLVHCVATGAWPVWDPYIGFGQPLWANPNNQVLYPFTWLNLLFAPLTVYGALAVSHTLWGAFGVYFLARALGGSRPAATVGGMLWMLSGPIVSVVNLWNHMTAAAWLPWSVLAADRAGRSGSRRAVLGWSLALAAQLLAGSPDVLAISLSASVAWALVAGRHALRRSLGLALLAVSLALAVSAAQWLPSLELARRTGRADVTVTGGNVWAVHPFSLGQALLPARLYTLPLRQADRDRLFEGRDPFLHSIYLGLASLALVAAGVGAARPALRALLVSLLAVAILVALGSHTPLVAALTALLPPLRMLRYPAKALLGASLAWALLGARGFDACHEQGAGSRLRWPLALLGGVSVLLAAHVLTQPRAWSEAFLAGASGVDVAGLLRPEAWRLSVAGAAAFAAALVVGRGGPRRAGLLAALALGDLLFAHHDLNRTAPRGLFETPPPAATAAAAGPLTRVYSWDYSAYVPGRRYRRDVTDKVFVEPDPGRPGEPELSAALRGEALLVPQTQARWALRGSFDRDIVLLQSPQSQQLMRLLRASEETPTALRLLRIGGVDSVVALHTVGLEALQPLAVLDGPFSRPVRVLRVPGALPPLFVVGRARVATDDEAVALLLSDAFDPASEVLLSTADRGAAADHGPSLGAVRLLDARPDRLLAETELDHDGWLVTLEAYDPDWVARVDGVAAPVRRANLAFRAVAVPAGRHRVEQRYRPASLGQGFAVSGVGLLVLFGLALAWRGASDTTARQESPGS